MHATTGRFEKETSCVDAFPLTVILKSGAVGVFRVETARVRSNDKETPTAKSAVRPFIYRSGLRFSQFFSLVLRTVFYGYERPVLFQARPSPSLPEPSRRPCRRPPGR